MKVKDLMTKDVASCKPHHSLGEVARLMARYDCGIVPVVDEQGRVLGVVTDRDIGLALSTMDRNASDVPAGEVRTDGAFTCSPEDGVDAALKTLKAKRVRRLPVVDADGRLQGLLSLNDLVTSRVPKAKVYAAIRSLAAHRRKPAIRKAGMGAEEAC